MYFLKLVIVTLFAAGLLSSCGQPDSKSGTKNASSSQPSENSAGADRNKAGSDKPAQLNRAGSVDEMDPATSDLYAKNCMICHKDTGKGGKVTIEGKTLNSADLTSARMQARTDEKRLEGIKEGVPDEGMPAFKSKLSDEQTKSLIQYIRSLK